MIGWIIFLYLIVGIVWSCVWGWAVDKVVENKGYDENWFWWGFFFGFIALIVALTKPQCTYYSTQQPQWMDASGAPVIYNRLTTEDEAILKNGGWRCKCGRINASYTGTCACGEKKSESKPTVQQKQQEAKVLKKGGWKCNRCGTLNPEFIGFCSCGMTRGENKRINEKKNAEVKTIEKEENKENPIEINGDKFDEIKKYKDLLDSGIITQEEFEKKKHELLGL